MSGKRIAIVVVAMASSIAVGFSLQTALRAQNAAGQPPSAQSPQPPHKPALSRLERLPCFGCHNIEHYLKGKPKKPGTADADGDEPKGEFSHKVHQEQGVGHCHMCHALEGHFQVTIRKETCAGCH